MNVLRPHHMHVYASEGHVFPGANVIVEHLFLPYRKEKRIQIDIMS